MDQTAIEAEDGPVKGSAESCSVPDNRVENGSDIGRRATDYPEDLARRRLLVERLSEVTIARLQLREQPHVLDRDHRLVRESLEQRDLLVRERGHLRPSEHDRPNRRPLPQEWDTQD